MPYIDESFRNEEDDEEDKPQAGQPLAVGSSSAASTSAGGAAPAPVQPNAKAGQTPGRFVSFQQYFNANKAGAQKMSNMLAGGLQKEGDAVNQELGAKQTAFNNQVQAGTPMAAPVPLNQPTANKPAPTSGQAVAAPTEPFSLQGSNPLKPGSTPVTGPTAVDLQKTANQKYSGPNALSDDADAWASFMSKASQAASKANLTKDATGTQALLEEKMKGIGYSKAKSGFDSVLTQTAGSGDFSKLRSWMSALPANATKADAAAKDRASLARTGVETKAAQAQSELDAITQGRADLLKRQAEADEAARQAAAARRTPFQLAAGAGKAQDWDTYNNTNRAENTLRDIGKAFDPVGAGVAAATGKHPLDTATDAMDDMANQNGATLNGNKINWGLTGQFGTLHDDIKRPVYNSLTQEELYALERMSDPEQAAFVNKRIGEMALKAADALNSVYQKAGDTEAGLRAYLTKEYGLSKQEIDSLLALARMAPKYRRGSK